MNHESYSKFTAPLPYYKTPARLGFALQRREFFCSDPEHNIYYLTVDPDKGYGKVEVQLAVDRWREDDCDLCNGSGELVESEDE